MQRHNIFRNSVAVTVAVTILLALFGYLAGGPVTKAGAQTKAVPSSSAPIPAGTYTLDPAHTVIGFGVKHLGIAIVQGRFKDLAGTVEYNGQDPAKSRVNFSAKIASIDTGVAARDAHLRTADFFDAEKYPEMTFTSSRIEKAEKGYIMHGDLTIKGVTRPISFPFTISGAVKDPWGGTRFGAEATAELNRRDFGINYGNTLPGGGLDVANEVAIELHLEAVKSESKAGN